MRSEQKDCLTLRRGTVGTNFRKFHESKKIPISRIKNCVGCSDNTRLRMVVEVGEGQEVCDVRRK